MLFTCPIDRQWSLTIGYFGGRWCATIAQVSYVSSPLATPYLEYSLECRATTVNIDIFAQYIFSRISRMALDARKSDVSENYYHNRTGRINCYVRENLAARICLLMLDARKFSCAKICTSTVVPK